MKDRELELEKDRELDRAREPVKDLGLGKDWEPVKDRESELARAMEPELELEILEMGRE